MTAVRHSATHATGVQDTGGWGLIGMAAGIVAGFLVAFYVLVPYFPKDRGTVNLVLVTSVVVAMMTLGGALGYVLSRRKSRPAGR